MADTVADLMVEMLNASAVPDGERRDGAQTSR